VVTGVHVAERTTPPGALLDGRLEAFEKAYGPLTILTGHLQVGRVAPAREATSSHSSTDSCPAA
jgi:hypothetical protein